MDDVLGSSQQTQQHRQPQHRQDKGQHDSKQLSAQFSVHISPPERAPDTLVNIT